VVNWSGSIKLLRASQSGGGWNIGMKNPGESKVLQRVMGSDVTKMAGPSPLLPDSLKRCA
jgi:hypothetical protein